MNYLDAWIEKYGANLDWEAEEALRNAVWAEKNETQERVMRLAYPLAFGGNGGKEGYDVKPNDL